MLSSGTKVVVIFNAIQNNISREIMDININTAEKPDRPHILLVDDDSALLDLIVDLFDHFGYSATTATGSDEAISKFKENPDLFDVVLTDYSLPVINGVELAKLIKKLSADIPIILCSGKIDLLDKRQIAAAGITDITRKPYKINELDSIIRRVMH